MATFDPNIFLQGAGQSAQQNSQLLDTFQNLANMYVRSQQLQGLKAEQARKDAMAKAMQPENIMAKAFRGEQLSPEESSRLQAWDVARTTQLTTDPLGRSIPKFQSVYGAPAISPAMGGLQMMQAQPQATQEPTLDMGVSQEAMESPFAQQERVKSQVALEKEARQFEFDKKKARPQLDTKFNILKDDISNINSVIDKAIEQSGALTTGFVGSIGKHIGGTEASNLASNLATIQADAAFGRLQEMRDASPTGGALGAISERELALLQNAKVALEQSQTEDQLDANLRRYKEIRANALNNVAEAYKKDYGVYPKGFGEQAKASKQATDGIQEGKTATNPQTGEKLIFRGGQWQRM